MWPKKAKEKEEPGSPESVLVEVPASEPEPVPALAVHELISALSCHPGMSKVLARVSATDCELVAEDAEGNRAPIIALITMPR